MIDYKLNYVADMTCALRDAISFFRADPINNYLRNEGTWNY